MRELHQFVEVAARRSISAAAKHLNISQPALSRAIRKLEDSYGAPLFVRNGAGVELSSFGSALYSRAVRVLPALNEAREEIEQMQGRAKAAIRIGAGDFWGLVILPSVIGQFSQAFPNVVVHVEITDEGARLQGLRNGVYDLVFGTMSAGYSAITPVEFETMARQSTYVYCDRNHPLALQGKVTADDLAEQRWISPGYDDDSGYGQQVRQARDFAVRADTVMNALMLLRRSPLLMSASSGFISLFGEFGVRALAIDELGATQDSGAIYPARSLERPIVRDFLRRAREFAAALDLPKLT